MLCLSNGLIHSVAMMIEANKNQKNQWLSSQLILQAHEHEDDEDDSIHKPELEALVVLYPGMERIY